MGFLSRTYEKKGTLFGFKGIIRETQPQKRKKGPTPGPSIGLCGCRVVRFAAALIWFSGCVRAFYGCDGPLWAED